MGLDRRFEAVVQYTEEGVAQVKDVVAFLKKRQAIENEYAKSLSKLCQTMLASQKKSRPKSADLRKGSSDERVKCSVSSTTLWNGIMDIIEETNNIANAHEKISKTMESNMIDPLTSQIKEWEGQRKQLIADGTKSTISLQEAYTQLKKSKTDYDDLQRQSDEAEEKKRLAQSNPAIKEKELEKLVTRSQQADTKAQDAKRIWLDKEDGSKQSQEQFYNIQLPDLLDKFKLLERERSTSLFDVLGKYQEMEQVHTVDKTIHASAMLDKLNSVDIEEDVQEFIADHIEDDSQGSNVPARSLINPLKAGRLMRQHGDVFNLDWKVRYCVLMYNEQKLYMFESEDSIKPKGIVDLNLAQTHSMDDSYFERKHCFQIVLSDYLVKKDVTRIFYMAAENEHEKAEWLRLLRVCDFTRFLSTMQQSDNEYRIIKSLRLEILEAKDLPISDIIRRSSDPFCLISLGYIKVARTVTKVNTLSPFWGESFWLDDIAHNHRQFVIEICSLNRIGIQRFSVLCKVHVPFDSLGVNVEREEWYPLVSPAVDADVSKFVVSTTDLGSIRIKVTFVYEKILPMQEYEPLVQLLYAPDMAVLNALNSVIKQKEDLAKNLLRFSAVNKNAVEFLRRLTHEEVESTDDPNIIFRGNSMATKSLDQFMKMVGTDYLHNTLKTLVKNVYKDKESCEVDPTRLEKGEDIKRNWKRLMTYVTQFWDSIYNSADKCPWELKVVFYNLQKDVAAKFDNDKVRHTAVAGFIFLRFFCPAILDPKLFGMAAEHPDNNTGRTFTLIAKTLQNLANLVEFGAKEPYMADMNQFILKNIDAARTVIDRVSTPPSSDGLPSTLSSSSIDARREISSIYRTLQSKLPDIRAAQEQAANEALDRLSQVLNSLEQIHVQYEMRMAASFNSRGDSRSRSPPPMPTGITPLSVPNVRMLPTLTVPTSGTLSPLESPTERSARGSFHNRPAPAPPVALAAIRSASDLAALLATEAAKSLNKPGGSSFVNTTAAQTPVQSPVQTAAKLPVSTPPEVPVPMARRSSMHKTENEVLTMPTSPVPAPRRPSIHKSPAESEASLPMPSGPPPTLARKPSLTQPKDEAPLPSIPPPQKPAPKPPALQRKLSQDLRETALTSPTTTPPPPPPSSTKPKGVPPPK